MKDEEATLAQISRLSGEAERNRTLLAEALPWLQDEQALLRGEVARYNSYDAQSPQYRRTVDTLENITALIAKIEAAIGVNQAAVRFDADGRPLPPGATCPRCDGPGATNVYSDGRACPFCGATIDAGDDEEGDD